MFINAIEHDEEMDYITRSLLMPKHFLIRDILNLKDSLNKEELVSHLAERYQVSEMQMTIRLLEVGGAINLKQNKVVFYE